MNSRVVLVTYDAGCQGQAEHMIKKELLWEGDAELHPKPEYFQKIGVLVDADEEDEELDALDEIEGSEPSRSYQLEQRWDENSEWEYTYTFAGVHSDLEPTEELECHGVPDAVEMHERR